MDAQHTVLKNNHTFVLLYLQELFDRQEAWTQQHMQLPGEEEMFFFVSQIISLWKKRYVRGKQVLLLYVLGITSWWRMSRNYVQSDLDNREMTNVMPAWKALKVFWKRSSKSTCTLEIEGKKNTKQRIRKDCKVWDKGKSSTRKSWQLLHKLGSIQRGSVVLLSASVTWKKF